MPATTSNNQQSVEAKKKLKAAAKLAKDKANEAAVGLEVMSASFSAPNDQQEQGSKIGQGDKVPLETKFHAAATLAGNHGNFHNQEEKKDDGADGAAVDPSKVANDNWAKVAYGAKIVALQEKAKRAATNERLFSRAVVNATTWDVWSPPPCNSLSGKVVPRIVNRHQHRRKISLEIHRVTPMLSGESEDENDATSKNNSNTQQQLSHSYQECVVRMHVPATKELNRKVRLDALKKIANKTTQSSSDTFNSVQEIRYDETDFDHDDNIDDDASVDTTASSASTDEGRYPALKDHGGKEFDGWKPRYCIPMHSIYVRGHSKKTVTILISMHEFKQERDLIFDTIEDSKSFVKKIEKQTRLETVRQDDRLKIALGGEISLPKFEMLTLLFEIVSGYDLPVGDYTTSDPYVSAFLGHEEIHRTDVVYQTLNPIWTLKTGSLFLLTVESRRLFIEEGIKFVIKDYDKIGKDEVLGMSHVDPKVLYRAQGERMEFKVVPSKKSNTGAKSQRKLRQNQGTLVLRCRRASQYDQKFMAEFAKQESKNAKGVASYEAPKADTSVIKTLTTKVKKKDASTGEMLYKIRPFADPMRPPDETEWMSKGDIQEAVLQPSHHWVDIGEGSLGLVYLEILGCDGLPNMDRGRIYGNKTDTFVAVVYEDVYGRTDVIDDCLSPRWLPWSNRAFICHIAYPSSFLNLGIFDFDSGSERVANHDLIGRVSVDLTNFRSGTEYVLSYNICASARLSDRKSLGKLMIRLRIEIPDERKFAMAALYPPPPIYVNTKLKKDFEVIRQTLLGSVDEEKYSISTLKSYVDEIYELQHLLFYIEDGLMAVLLWRGTFEMTIPYLEVEVDLPLQSLCAFLISIFLVEHPTFIPSFCFGSLAWLLMAVGVWRQESENVWWRCHSYAQILNMILLGDDYAMPHSIQPFENVEEAQKETANWIKRIEDSEKRAAEAAKDAELAQQEWEREVGNVGESTVELDTKVNNTGIIEAGIPNIVKAALYPIQLMLGMLVRLVRVIKNVLVWQEAYISFWITTGSLVLAIISLFVPWFWCIKWGSRILAWTLFGPWMKLVDIYYFSLTGKEETEEQRQRRLQAEKLAGKLTRSEYVNKARIERENVSKLKAMKRYMFGSYAVRIPVIKQDRYADIPLAESFATPYREKEFSLGELAIQEAGYKKKRIPGQTLTGDMIPYVMEEDFTLAPTGKPALQTEKLSKSAAGSNVGSVTNPSKVVSAVALAVGITYFGTSMFATLLAQTDKWVESNGEL